MADPRHLRGLIDTSVVIDLDVLDPERLPAELAVSAITLAELAAGPHAAADPVERARRQDRLQRVEATFEALPVDVNVARAYGRVYAAVITSGRKARGRRATLAQQVVRPLALRDVANNHGDELPGSNLRSRNGGLDGKLSAV